SKSVLGERQSQCCLQWIFNWRRPHLPGRENRNETLLDCALIYCAVRFFNQYRFQSIRRPESQLAAVARPRLSGSIERQKSADRVERDEECSVENGAPGPRILSADHLGQEGLPDH